MIKTEPINIACKIFSEVLIITDVWDSGKKRSCPFEAAPLNI
jgi:hypothetical protein